MRNLPRCGQMMPEQVWDEADWPERSLRLGQPAGSAVPLVWAHAEYLKLLRSAVDGKVFDRIEPVYERYCAAGGAQAAAGAAWRSTAGGGRSSGWTRAARCAFWMRADLRWCGATTAGRRSTPTASRSSGQRGVQRGYCARGRRAGKWNGRCTGRKQDAWLGYNVKVKMDQP